MILNPCRERHIVDQVALHRVHAVRRRVGHALVRGDDRPDGDGVPLDRPFPLGLKPGVAQRPPVLQAE